MRVLCGYRSRAFRAETEFFIYLVPSKTFFYDYFFLFNFPVPSFRFPEVAPLPWPLHTSGARSPVYSGVVAAAAVHDDGYWPTRVPPCDVIRILYDVTDRTHASIPKFTTTRRTRIARTSPLTTLTPPTLVVYGVCSKSVTTNPGSLYSHDSRPPDVARTFNAKFHGGA